MFTNNIERYSQHIMFKDLKKRKYYEERDIR